MTPAAIRIQYRRDGSADAGSSSICAGLYPVGPAESALATCEAVFAGIALHDLQIAYRKQVRARL